MHARNKTKSCAAKRSLLSAPHKQWLSHPVIAKRFLFAFACLLIGCGCPDQKNLKSAAGFGRGSLSLRADPRVVAVGEPIYLTAERSDGAKNKRVDFKILRGSAHLQDASKMTDDYGVAETVLTAEEAGEVEVQAESVFGFIGLRQSNSAIVIFAAPNAVAIDPVIRDGDQTLPHSIAPGKTIQLTVTIPQGFLGQNENIQLSVVGDNADNGSVEIVNNAPLQQTGVITVKGVNQTKPGKGGNLLIVAKKNGQGAPVGATPRGFTVCAHPVNFRLVGIWNNDNAKRYGMSVVTRWDSDAANGDATLLDKVWRKEKVTARPADPAWKQTIMQVSGWRRGDQKGDGALKGTAVDEHQVVAAALDPNPPTQPSVDP